MYFCEPQSGSCDGASLAALGDAVLAACASADVANDALGGDQQPPAQTQPTTEPAWLTADAEERDQATNLKWRITNA
ncbi:MAG TPA: hypothetical protein VJT54_01290 [Verrucomicrobiae bacterium]|nr:hypothetical protein [Verrucomicrobiae bacterium]